MRKKSNSRTLQRTVNSFLWCERQEAVCDIIRRSLARAKCPAKRKPQMCSPHSSDRIQYRVSDGGGSHNFQASTLDRQTFYLLHYYYYLLFILYISVYKYKLNAVTGDPESILWQVFLKHNLPIFSYHLPPFLSLHTHTHRPHLPYRCNIHQHIRPSPVTRLSPFSLMPFLLYERGDIDTSLLTHTHALSCLFYLLTHSHPR